MKDSKADLEKLCGLEGSVWIDATYSGDFELTGCCPEYATLIAYNYSRNTALNVVGQGRIRQAYADDFLSFLVKDEDFRDNCNAFLTAHFTKGTIFGGLAGSLNITTMIS